MGTTLRWNAEEKLLVVLLVNLVFLSQRSAVGIRFRELPPPVRVAQQPHQQISVFALGSFWRSEAAFGCLPGVVRTTVGYCGGSKRNPAFRTLGDHAECVKIEYDPKIIQYKQLLDVFWSSHDSRQAFGQGPDVGNQYRSIIFTNGTLEARLAAAGKEREQTRSRDSIVTTQIQQLGTFYPAEIEHQKFELKRNKFLLQLIGSMPDEELTTSNLATRLNGYAAELCPPKVQKQIDAKIDEILKSGWPLLTSI